MDGVDNDGQQVEVEYSDVDVLGSGSDFDLGPASDGPSQPSSDGENEGDGTEVDSEEAESDDYGQQGSHFSRPVSGLSRSEVTAIARDGKRIMKNLEQRQRNDLALHLYSTFLLHQNSMDPKFPKPAWANWPLVSLVKSQLSRAKLAGADLTRAIPVPRAGKLYTDVDDPRGPVLPKLPSSIRAELEYVRLMAQPIPSAAWLKEHEEEARAMPPAPEVPNRQHSRFPRRSIAMKNSGLRDLESTVPAAEHLCLELDAAFQRQISSRIAQTMAAAQGQARGQQTAINGSPSSRSTMRIQPIIDPSPTVPLQARTKVFRYLNQVLNRLAATHVGEGPFAYRASHSWEGVISESVSIGNTVTRCQQLFLQDQFGKPVPDDESSASRDRLATKGTMENAAQMSGQVYDPEYIRQESLADRPSLPTNEELIRSMAVALPLRHPPEEAPTIKRVSKASKLHFRRLRWADVYKSVSPQELMTNKLEQDESVATKLRKGTAGRASIKEMREARYGKAGTGSSKRARKRKLARSDREAVSLVSAESSRHTSEETTSRQQSEEASSQR